MSKEVFYDRIDIFNIFKIIFNYKDLKINYFEISKYLLPILPALKINNIIFNKLKFDISELKKNNQSYYWYHFEIMDEMYQKVLGSDFFNEIDSLDETFCKDSAIIYFKKKICSTIQKDCMNIAIINSIYNDKKITYYSHSISLFKEDNYYLSADQIQLIYKNQIINKSIFIFKRILRLIYLNLLLLLKNKKKINSDNKQIISLLESSGIKNNFFQRGDPEWNLKKNDINYHILVKKLDTTIKKKFLNENKIHYIDLFGIKLERNKNINYLKKIFFNKILNFFNFKKKFIKFYLNIEMANLFFDSLIFSKYFYATKCKKFVYLDPYRPETDIINFLKNFIKIKTIMIQYSFLKNDKSPHMHTFPSQLLLFSNKFKSIFLPKIYYKNNIIPEVILSNYIFNNIDYEKYELINNFKLNNFYSNKFIIGVLDESFGHALISKKFYESLILKLINYNQTNPNFIFLFKPQFTFNSLKIIFKDNQIIQNAIENKVIIELIDHSNRRNQILPGTLSLLSDITFGFFFGGTASLEASFYNRSLMLDIHPLNNEISNYYRDVLKKNKILYENLDNILADIKSFLNGEIDIGKWDDIYPYIFESTNFKEFNLDDYLNKL